MLVESRSQPGHDGSHRSLRHPRLHDVVFEQVGNEVLAQEADGTALDCLGRVGVTVAEVAGDTAEEIPGTTRRLSWEMPATTTEAGSPTDSITSTSSKRRFMGTVRMIDPTALHAPDTFAARPQWVCR